MPRKKQRPLWVTREGDAIPLPDIEDSHLVNILMMLRRQAQARAQRLADEDAVTLGPGGWRIDKHRQWEDLVAEARSRGPKVAAAVNLIDSDDLLDEEMVRSSFRRDRNQMFTPAPPPDYHFLDHDLD